MLVLSRKQNESILFPELGITVKVILTKGNQVRLGIEAPKSVRIVRGEIADRREFIDPVKPTLVGKPTAASIFNQPEIVSFTGVLD